MTLGDRDTFLYLRMGVYKMFEVQKGRVRKCDLIYGSPKCLPTSRVTVCIK